MGEFRNKMVKNGKYLLIIVGVILVMANMQGTEKKESGFEAIQAALPPITLGANQIVKVDSFPHPPIDFITQSSGLFAIVGDPGGSGDWCCDSSCGAQCTGSLNFCDAWCKEREGPIPDPRCPSGYILVPGTNLCCPSDIPYYCASANLCYQFPNCQLCPSGVEGGGGQCCSGSNPYYCAEQNSCYDSLESRERFCNPPTGNQIPLIAESIPNPSETRVKIQFYITDVAGNPLSPYVNGAKPQDGFYEIGAELANNAVAIDIYEAWDDKIIGNDKCFTDRMVFSVRRWQSSKIKIIVDTPENLGLPPWWSDSTTGVCYRGELIPNLLSECTPSQIRCNGINYNSCVDIGSGTYRFSDTIQSCPAGNICSNSVCVTDFSGVCNDVKDGILSAITAWANSPSDTAKSQILTRITDWAGKC